MRQEPHYELGETIMSDSNKETYVSAITIRKNSISYELTHLDDLFTKIVWLDEERIDRILVKSGKRLPINHQTIIPPPPKWPKGKLMKEAGSKDESI